MWKNLPNGSHSNVKITVIGVQDRDEVVGVALHPRVARRQHQPGDADREQQDQRQEVLRELLQRRRAPSRMRRRMASITPAMTRNDAQTRPWKIEEGDGGCMREA